ncbi:MAG: carbohydrate kinase family protein [Pseudomonadota bacterium]
MKPDRRGIICAGNWIVDLVHDIEHWPDESNLARIGDQTRGIGGGAANVIRGLARLQTGLPLWPMGAIGDDEPGAFILEGCRRLGLPTDKLSIKPGVPTAHTHVMSVAGRSRTFFYQGGANDALAASDFPQGTFAQTPARVFYLGYLSLLGELDLIEPDGISGAARVLQRAQQAGLTTCVDLVSVLHPEFHKIVESAAPFIDYLVLNEIEAARATETEVESQSLIETKKLFQMASSLTKLGVTKAVVVHCVERAVWHGTDGTKLSVEIAALPPEEIGSNLGAGDAFCAGLIFALHENWSPERALDLAVATARASLRGYTATEAIPPLAQLELT